MTGKERKRPGRNKLLCLNKNRFIKNFKRPARFNDTKRIISGATGSIFRSGVSAEMVEARAEVVGTQRNILKFISYGSKFGSLQFLLKSRK
jgi:hypothetical protein